MKEDMENLLSMIVTDCQMALDDTWDRSDDGFVAMQDRVYEMANKYDLDITSQS